MGFGMSRERASFRLLCPLDSIFWLITSGNHNGPRWCALGLICEQRCISLESRHVVALRECSELPQVPAIIELTDSAGVFGSDTRRIELHCSMVPVFPYLA